MGMFDTVMIPCPKCGELYDAQTKSGDCLLRYYDWPSEGATNPAPYDVMNDINRHAPYTCQCGTKFQVKTVRETVVTVVPGEWAVEIIEDGTN